jgi:hypothetical protein
MTLRTAIAPRVRSEAGVFRVSDGSRLAASEAAELASGWGAAPSNARLTRHDGEMIARLHRDARAVAPGSLYSNATGGCVRNGGPP